MNIAGIEIGPGHPCRTVAEISNNHNGDRGRAIRLIQAAKDAGADLVKFQAYTPKELIALRGDGAAPEPWGSQGLTMGELYTRAQTPLLWLPDLFAYARRIKLPAFASVFGLESLSALENCECPAFKIAALDRLQGTLRDTVVARGKPVLLSSPDPTPKDIPFSIVAVYCPPGYPTAPRDVRLPDFRCAGCYVGLSSHCLDPLLPVAAVARGAKLLEYHFQLDDEPSELESEVSLTASEFAQMVKDIRAVEEMLA